MGSAAQARHVSVCEFVAAGDFLWIIYCEQTIICITRLTSYQELLQHTDCAIMYC